MSAARRTSTSTGPVTTAPNVDASRTTPLGQPPRLAKTGVDTSTLFAGGLVTLAIGVALTVLGRRRVFRNRPRHAA